MRTIHSAVAAGLMFTGLATGSVAAADTISTASATEFKRLLSNEKVSYEIMKEDNGRPSGLHGVLETTVGKINFVVRAKGCNQESADCESFIFFANWDLGRDITTEDYQVINGYNDSNLHGRAFILEKAKKVGVDYVVDLRGGVTPKFLRRSQERWRSVVISFLTHFSSGSGSAD